MFASSFRPHLLQRALPVLMFLAAASAGLAPSADGDIWWHLAAGREMVARGALLHSDPFSLSAAGRPWIDVHWLFQLAVYAVERFAGLTGLIFVKCALLGVGAMLLHRALPAGRSWARPLLATLLLAGLLAARSLLLVRPVIATLVLLAFFFCQLEAFRRDGRLRHLSWLLPAQVLWNNLQGLSALGPALLLAYAVPALLQAWLGERWPRWLGRESARATTRFEHARGLGLALAACVVATCLTPFGLRGAAFPSFLLGRLLPTSHNVFSRGVAENVPPFVLEHWAGGEFWHLKWFVLLFALTLLLAGRRLLLSHALLLAGFLGLALIANRNVLLFYWMAAPIGALQAAPRLRAFVARSRAPGLRVARFANAAVFVGLLAISGRAFAGEPPLAEPSPFRVPAQSARKLASLPRGDVFAADHYGGYLIWQLYPRFKPYIDTRLVLRTDAEYAEFLGLLDYPARFHAFQAQHRFSYVLLPVAFPERYQRLIVELYASPDWKLLLTDGTEVLFGHAEQTRSSAAPDLSADMTTDQIVGELDARFARAPKARAAARMNLATLQTLVGEFTQAERTLGGVDSSDAEALRARCRFAAGDLPAAERLAQGSLSRDRADVRSLNLLAHIALRRGEAGKGVALVRRALGIAPFDAEASRILSQLEESQP